MKTMKILLLGVCLACLAGCISSHQFQIGGVPDGEVFSTGDSIVIKQVTATSASVGIHDRVMVKGEYTLRSRESARLVFYVAVEGPSYTIEGSPRSQQLITEGSGTFELEADVHLPGTLFVALYPSGSRSPIGRIELLSVGGR